MAEVTSALSTAAVTSHTRGAASCRDRLAGRPGSWGGGGEGAPGDGTWYCTWRAAGPAWLSLATTTRPRVNTTRRMFLRRTRGLRSGEVRQRGT